MPSSLQSATCLIGVRELHYVRAGAGPALMFLHGVLGSHRVWADLERDLAADHLMIAPDLFGHGASDKRSGDYSLGAHAGTVRDLLDHLGLARVTLVGHSLGGGIAMEFVYLFPERVDGLVLVASGGLGPDVSLLLRAPTLPGAEWVLPLVASRWASNQGKSLGRGLQFLGFRGGTDVAQAWHGFKSLSDGDSRRAFLSTIRSVVGPEGQRVSALEFLPRLRCPTLLVWGDRDRMIPLSHGQAAVELIPGARLEVFAKAGHFPHLDHPQRFAALLREFSTSCRTDAAPPPAPRGLDTTIGPEPA
jgi:pimeloyl-ACP methyl ester carboxylesterase